MVSVFLEYSLQNSFKSRPNREIIGQKNSIFAILYLEDFFQGIKFGMKFNLVVDENQEPSVTVVCNRVTSAVRKIEELCKELDFDEGLLYGYADEEVLPLELALTECFFTKNGKVFAVVAGREYATKLRIKQVLERVDDSFIKVNQGCVINVRFVQKFTVSIGGALKIVLKSGFSDYVARRELSNIKRRFGL